MSTFTLNNGVVMPRLGFGTWRSQEGTEAYQAVRHALSVGYRHIDTAAIYGNEESVGQAIKDSGVPRNELFVTTKLWNDAHNESAATAALHTSLEKLGLDYVDLYLIHWPNPLALRDRWQATNAETWRALEKANQQGLARAIGVSNFMVHHLEALLQTAKIVPAVNQIRLAPGVTQPEVVAYCRAHSIIIEAWSPLGQGELFQHPTMQALAEKYQKTIAQVALAWSLNHGFVPLPKSVTPKRIEENFACTDIQLSLADRALLDDLTGVTGAPDPDTVAF